MLHPTPIAKITAPDLKIRIEEVSKFYELERIESGAELCRFFFFDKQEGDSPNFRVNRRDSTRRNFLSLR